MAAVYSIICLINGWRYIGVSYNPSGRRSKHFHELRRQVHNSKVLQQDYNQYGVDNFRFEILEEFDINELSKQEVELLFKQKEDKYISRLNTIYPNGYNKQTGGAKGFKICEDTRQKKSIAAIGKTHSIETKQKLREVNLGKKMSDEVKEKIKITSTGRKLSAEVRKKISIAKAGKKRSFEDAELLRQHNEVRKKEFYLYNIDTNQVIYSRGVNNFAREHGLDHSSIRLLIKGKMKIYQAAGLRMATEEEIQQYKNNQ